MVRYVKLVIRSNMQEQILTVRYADKSAGWTKSSILRTLTEIYNPSPPTLLRLCTGRMAERALRS